MKECVYCGRKWEPLDGCCSHCGAPDKLSQIEKYDPFFYEGCIVYAMRLDYLRAYEWVFYKGDTVVGVVRMSEMELLQYFPTEDIMPIVLERLRQG